METHPPLLDGIGASIGNVIVDGNLIYLTTEELRGITGLRRASAQIRWLGRQGFRVLRKADGSPLVSRANFEATMGGMIPGSPGSDSEPDFDALR